VPIAHWKGSSESRSSRREEIRGIHLTHAQLAAAGGWSEFDFRGWEGKPPSPAIGSAWMPHHASTDWDLTVTP